MGFVATAQYLAWLAGPNANKGSATMYGAPVVKPTPDAGDTWDDFDGPAGSPPSALWLPVDGVVRGPSTTTVDNVVLDGDSNLDLVAIEQGDGTWQSALAVTAQTLGYGTYSAAIKMPGGAGLHGSFWMLGEGYNFFGTSPVPWPHCGEVDIVEYINDFNYYSTVHGPLNGVATQTNYQSQIKGRLGFDASADFHVYTAVKLKGQPIKFLIDGTETNAIGKLSAPPGQPWDVEVPQQVIFSLTVNGPDGWGGPINGATPTDVSMAVDWFHFVPDPNA